MTPTWAETPDLSTRGTRMKSRLQPRPKSASTSGSVRHAAGTTASERHEAEQTTRKRTLVDALHADADDVASGCRWAGVAKRRQPNATEAPPVFPMRIAAVRGDVFCFQNVYYSTEDPMATVQLLHRDEFDVAWQTMNVGETAIGTPWNGAGLEEEFEWRRTACYEDAVYPEDDEDEDEDE